MKRVIEPEWLDELDSHDPRALRSRRDIHRLNALMGNRAILARLLRRASRHAAPARIVDLGAGDGMFTLRLARSLAFRWRRVHVVLVDSKNVVTCETRHDFMALGWCVEVVTADVPGWLRNAPDIPADIIIANLFLHQFPDRQLAEMLSLAAGRTRLFTACEPRRSRFALALSRMLGVIGCNDVTRHDGVASVRAGFRGRELSTLWPAADEWQLREGRAGLLAHSFLAARTGPGGK
jgi:hypothetical protein